MAKKLIFTILLTLFNFHNMAIFAEEQKKEHRGIAHSVERIMFISETGSFRLAIKELKRRGCPIKEPGSLSSDELETWFQNEIFQFERYSNRIIGELKKLKTLTKTFKNETVLAAVRKYLNDGKKLHSYLIDCLRYQNVHVRIERRKERDKNSKRSIKLENACSHIRHTDFSRDLISSSKIKKSHSIESLIHNSKELVNKVQITYRQNRDHYQLFDELQRAMKIKLLYTLYETAGIIELPHQKTGNSWVRANNGRAHVTALLNGLEDNVGCSLGHNDYKTFLEPIIKNPETAQERLLRIKKAIISLNRHKRKYQLSLMKNVELLKKIQKFHPAGETSIRGSRIRFNTYGDATITVKKDGGLSEMKKFITKYYPELKEKYPTLTFYNPPPELTKDEIGQTLWQMYLANRQVATYARIELLQGDTKDDYRTKGNVVAILGSELVFPYRTQFQSSRSVWKIVKRFEKSYKKYIHLITKQKEHAREILEAFTELFIEFPELIKANQTFYEAILEIPNRSAIFSLSYYRDFWKNLVVLPTKSEMTDSIKERRKLILEELTNVCSEERPEDSGDQKDIMYQWAHHPDILAFIVKYRPNLLERLCRIYKKKQSVDKRNGILMLSLIPVGIVSALAAPVFPITAAILGAVPIGVGMAITVSDVKEYFRNKDLWQLGLIDYQTLKESKERAITSLIIELATLPFAISGLKQSIKEIRNAKSFHFLHPSVRKYLKTRKHFKALKVLMKEMSDEEIIEHLERTRRILNEFKHGLIDSLDEGAYALKYNKGQNQVFDDIFRGANKDEVLKRLKKMNKIFQKEVDLRTLKNPPLSIKDHRNILQGLLKKKHLILLERELQELPPFMQTKFLYYLEQIPKRSKLMNWIIRNIPGRSKYVYKVMQVFLEHSNYGGMQKLLARAVGSGRPLNIYERRAVHLFLTQKWGYQENIMALNRSIGTTINRIKPSSLLKKLKNLYIKDSFPLEEILKNSDDPWLLRSIFNSDSPTIKLLRLVQKSPNLDDLIKALKIRSQNLRDLLATKPMLFKRWALEYNLYKSELFYRTLLKIKHIATSEIDNKEFYRLISGVRDRIIKSGTLKNKRFLKKLLLHHLPRTGKTVETLVEGILLYIIFEKAAIEMAEATGLKKKPKIVDKIKPSKRHQFRKCKSESCTYGKTSHPGKQKLNQLDDDLTNGRITVKQYYEGMQELRKLYPELFTEKLNIPEKVLQPKKAGKKSENVKGRCKDKKTVSEEECEKLFDGF